MTAILRGTTEDRGWRTEAPQRSAGRREVQQWSAGRRTWAATAWLVAGTIAVAVTSYTLSLQVASERRDMERLAQQNRALEADLKALDAELRVRMRMPQLQRWNDSVLGLVPISATQYLSQPVQLAAYGTAPAAPALPRVQLAVRDLAPDAKPSAAGPVLVSAPATAAPAAPLPIARPAAAPVLARPAPEAAPADLLQQVEMSFGDQPPPQP